MGADSGCADKSDEQIWKKPAARRSDGPLALPGTWRLRPLPGNWSPPVGCGRYIGRDASNPGAGRHHRFPSLGDAALHGSGTR